MMRVSGVEPVRTLTDVAAEAVTGTSETTRKIATSRNRDFWAKLSLQSQGARVRRAADWTKTPTSLKVPDVELEIWWARLGSNQRPTDYESAALPLSYRPSDGESIRG